MTRHLIYIISLNLFLIFFKQCNAQGFMTDSCSIPNALKESNQNAKLLKTKLNELTQMGVPGVVLALNDKNGTWASASGYAKIEDLTPMQICHLLYLGSIPKTYMAVIILQLHEEGSIDLNSPINNYLPDSISVMITNADKVTVKMLLNHTSGIAEYNYSPAYVTKLLQQPERIFTPIEYLQYIKGKNQDFEPGSKYSYRNSNYVILSLIADYITGDHVKYMYNNILEPLKLRDTYYSIEKGNTYGNRLVNNYWDRYSNGILENSSILLNTNTASMVGDDGIVCTAIDALNFLRGLFGNRLLKPETIDLMKDFVLDEKGNPTYGLGLDYSLFQNEIAYGHSGGGLGTGCQLYYFPKQDLYFFMAINLATVTDSPIHVKAAVVLEDIYKILLGKN